MRLHRSLAIALAGGAALTLVIATPAAAASTTWIAPADSLWSTATWSSTVPAAGDDVSFNGGPRSTYNLGVLQFSTFTFLASHEIANGSGNFSLTNGLAVQAPAVAEIAPQLTAVGDQTWEVEAGARLQFPSAVYTDGTSQLTLDVDGVMAIGTAGNLDALATGCIVKQGSGVLELHGGGGGVGTCAGQPAGLLVTEGEVAIVGTPNLGGKNFAVTGGVITGGTDAAPAIIRELNLAGTGVVSPGASSGADLGHLRLWGTSTWTGGSYQVDWDADLDVADYVDGENQAILVSDTRLDIRLSGTPTAGQEAKIIGSNIAFTGQFSSSTVTPLADGDEFVSNGQVFSISYVASGTASGATLTWLRADETAPGPGLADTGADPAIALGAGVLLFGSGILLFARRRFSLGSH